jgi:PAS domain S-box-containing protein
MAQTDQYSTHTAAAIDGLQSELEQCRRDLNDSRRRTRELQRAETLLAGENRILEAVARGVALPEILADLCRLIEEQCEEALCGILLLDPVNHRVLHGAAPNLPQSYNDAIHCRVVTPEAGPCGLVVCSKEQVIAADIAADPRWDRGDWRLLALSHGLRACWSTPILSCGGAVLGTFAIYWREPRSPTAEDQKLIEQTTHLAAVTIERRQIEEKLRRNERGLTEAIDTIPGLVWSVHTDGEVDFLNRRWREYTGMTLEQARGWGWRAAIHFEDLPGLEIYWRSVLASGQPGETEARLRRQDGTFRWFLFRAVPLYDEAGRLVKWYGQNTDIDDRKKATEALRASEHLARGQLEALASSLASLSRESVPEKFLEHVLRIAGEQLEAAGVSVWEMNEQIGCVELAAIYQGGVLQVPGRNEEQPPLRMTGTSAEHPVWTEFFRTGRQCVYGRIHNGPPWSEVAIHPDGPWYDWRAGMVDNPIVPQMIKDVAASGIVATLNVPMLVADKVAGLFVLCFKRHRVFRPDEMELTRAMANQAMLAAKLMRLSQANRESAVIAERNRMARDLHDTLAQGFTGIIMQLEATKGAMGNVDTTAALVHIERAERLARDSLGEARRSVRAIRSRSLVDGTLSTALDELLKRMTSGTELQAELVVQGDGRPLPPHWEEGLLRITQESLTNTMKYAQARRFRASLSFMPGAVRLQLVDDGRGFDPQAEHEGFGLIGMRERAEQMAGNFIQRSKPGEGTEIVIELNQPNGANGNHEIHQA